MGNLFPVAENSVQVSVADHLQERAGFSLDSVFKHNRWPNNKVKSTRQKIGRGKLTCVAILGFID